jgi:hypothetical protein
MRSFKQLRQLTEKKSLKKACWDGYEAIGMKNKDGRQVPNCVPIKEEKEKETAPESLASTIKNVHLLGTKTIVGLNVNDTLHIQSIKHGNRTSYRWKSSRGEAGNWTSKNHAMKFGTRYAKRERFKSAITEEETKPYKGFVQGKNHPEGGLSRKEAKRHGIHAGIETKDEAKRKGGFGKLSDKTQARRKSFCARMCGMKSRNTSSKTARDPKSKINAALRVWGCRC